MGCVTNTTAERHHKAWWSLAAPHHNNVGQQLAWTVALSLHHMPVLTSQTLRERAPQFDGTKCCDLSNDRKREHLRRNVQTASVFDSVQKDGQRHDEGVRIHQCGIFWASGSRHVLVKTCGLHLHTTTLILFDSAYKTCFVKPTPRVNCVCVNNLMLGIAIITRSLIAQISAAMLQNWCRRKQTILCMAVLCSSADSCLPG